MTKKGGGATFRTIFLTNSSGHPAFSLLSHRNLSTRRRMLKKGRILYCKYREVLLSPVKMILCSKLPCVGWRSADFLKGFFAKNVCLTSTNILVLALRLLCSFRQNWFENLRHEQRQKPNSLVKIFVKIADKFVGYLGTRPTNLSAGSDF
jgi:hypothetical protein